MIDLDPWTLPLGGTKLIEASAGTGKTYTLTTLYLRLLVEADLLPSEILVVTYTQAATAELRERVRSRIQEAIEIGEQPAGRKHDPDFANLANLAQEARRRSVDEGRPDPLRRALAQFDEAAIFTIHGFCQRTLAENAFESGVAFDAELLTNSDSLQRTLANDLWAGLLEGEDPSFLEWLRVGAGRRWQFEPDELRRSVLGVLGADEEMPVLPELSQLDDCHDLSKQMIEMDDTWQRWARAWRASEENVSTIFLGDNDLNKNSYKQDTIRSKWIPRINRWVATIEAEGDAKSLNGIELPDWWKKWTPEGLAAGLKKNGRAIADPFFELCTELQAVIEALDRERRTRVLSLRRRFVEQARISAGKRRDVDHLLFFDDLLSELRAALRPPDGNRLVELLRSRYRFALIDEFQDTDPVQYEIFRRVWHEPSVDTGSSRSESPSGLVLIGDPKQAIYSFRGADLFTYFSARRDAGEEVYVLGVNWRSTPKLIAAVNALFGRPKNAFGQGAIEFSPVAARSKEAAIKAATGVGTSKQAAMDGDRVGLRVLMADRDRPDSDVGRKVQKAHPLRFGRTDLMRAFARDVADLLDSGVDIGGRPIRPADIAVLCRRKDELARARRELEALGIPCVDRGDSDVFESREAWELASVLRAMLRPGDAAVVRGALSTAAHGFDASAIASLSDEHPELTAIAERFSDYARIWSQLGFGIAFESWRRGEEVTECLLRLKDGERRLTNWLHLAELLQRIEIDRSASRIGLLAWLERAISSSEARAEVGAEASLLRLERDDQAVSLVTLHRSKGLEYEIVYLPCLWEDIEQKSSSAQASQSTNDGVDEGKRRPPIRFYDEQHEKTTLDLGGPDFSVYLEHAAKSRQEIYSEQLRLLYVGLTRAKRQCVMTWGAIGSAYTKTPFAWLLHTPDWTAEGQDRSTSAAELKKWTDEQWRSAVQGLNDFAGEAAVGIESANFEPRDRWQAPAIELAPLQFVPPVRSFGPSIVTTSFSALVRDAHRMGEPLSGPLVTGRDHDAAHTLSALEPAEATPDLACSMHEFPRGAEAGTLLHDVLEQIEFSVFDETETRAIATRAVDETHATGRARFDGSQIERIVHVVKSVADTPFRSEPTPLRLADLPRGSQRPEIEFTLASTGHSRHERFSPASLSALLESSPAESPLWCYASRVAKMTWRELNGYLRGFIDSVFFDGERYYLIDYKSNYLGSQQGDYQQNQLLQPMIDHDYVLQYLIYSIALDRHLAQRLSGYNYEAHFGGAYYFFLRGMAVTHAAGSGIFFDRPPIEIIRGAQALLGDLSGKVRDPAIQVIG